MNTSFNFTINGGLSKICLQLFYQAVFDIDNDSSLQRLNCIINILTSIAAIFVNFLAMFSIWKTPSLHSPSHVLLFGLAMSDYGVGLLVQPLWVVYLLARINDLSGLICISGILVTIGAFFFCTFSLLTLTAIGLDRFLAMHLVIRYKVVVTIKRAIYLLVGIWIFAASCTLLGLLLKDFDFILVVSATVTSIGICLMAFSYLRVFIVLHRHQTQITSHEENGQNASNMVAHIKKSSFEMFLICSLFVVCYLPFAIGVSVWTTRTGSKTAKLLAFEFSSTIVFVNSCLNPIVYSWRIHELRAAFRQTLSRYCRL